MSTNQQKNSSEEEVDLGSLFKIIGKGFSNLFKFIGNLFRGIFEFFISILIFLKKNALKIGTAGVIGLILGIFVQINKPPKYKAELLLEPNFKSTRQLYNNVNFYNDLVDQEQIKLLQEIFNLDSVSAASLKSFEVEPLKIDSDILNGFNDLILEVDTLSIRNYEYEDYTESFTDLDYRVHKVTVVAEKNDVFDKLDDIIISSISQNKYFNRIKEITNENLNRTDSLYRQNLSQIDSLRKVYITVMIEEAKKQTATGTSIDLGGVKKTTNELELFETNRKLSNDLKNIAEERSKQYEIINVISNFQTIGHKVSSVTKNYGFLFSVFGAGFMIISLLLVELNKYLENYKK